MNFFLLRRKNFILFFNLAKANYNFDYQFWGCISWKKKATFTCLYIFSYVSCLEALKMFHI